MDQELKSEFTEHQTLQDVIIKKIRDSIKKQESKDNPFKFFRLTLNDGIISYLEPSKWVCIDVGDEYINISISRKDVSININKEDQKDNDFTKLLNYIHQNSVDVSELINDWDRYFTRLREIYLHISKDCVYIKLSNIQSLKFIDQKNKTYLSINTKSDIYGLVLVYKPNDPDVQYFKKLMELLSQ